MKRLRIIIITSFFLILFFWFMGVLAFTEKIGDGSWNDDVFFGSTIGILAAIGTFIISLIMLLFESWRRKRS